jgi:hypothetical protein
VYVDRGTITMNGGTIYGSGAVAGLANTGANASLDGAGKYGNGSNIIASGRSGTNETLVGHN